MVKYCPRCGTPNEDDALYCIKCGAKLDRLDNSRVQQWAQKQTRNVILSEEGYSHLIELFHLKRKLSLIFGIIDLIFGVIMISVGLVFWQISVSVGLSGSIYVVLFLFIAFGIVFLSDGISELINFKKWEEEINYFMFNVKII
ncbi:MAG: zinc-ribbon domain-containing protein [Minisyncoccia bacterium]